MTERAHEIVRRWLTAERRAEEAPAERALSELMLRLPYVDPRPGFAGRVMAAANLEPALAPAGLSRPLTWALRALLGVCLLLTGTAVAILPSLIELAARRITLAEIVSGLAGTVTAVVDYMSVLVALGKFLGALYDALLLVLTAPPVAFTWLGAVVFSTLTLRWLARLLSPLGEKVLAERSSGYVSAHG